MDAPPLYSAAAIAKARLDGYLQEKLKAAVLDTDLETWKFYTALLGQAKKYTYDFSGYEPPAYGEDHALAVRNCKKDRPERF